MAVIGTRPGRRGFCIDFRDATGRRIVKQFPTRAEAEAAYEAFVADDLQDRRRSRGVAGVTSALPLPSLEAVDALPLSILPAFVRRLESLRAHAAARLQAEETGQLSLSDAAKTKTVTNGNILADSASEGPCK
jgi:hypothetical protein